MLDLYQKKLKMVELNFFSAAGLFDVGTHRDSEWGEWLDFLFFSAD